MLNQLLDKIRDRKLNYWEDRLTAQLKYAGRLSAVRKNVYDGIVNSAAQYVSDCIEKDGAVTRDAALKAESMLDSLSAEAKKYNILCAAHAHIDMNWMWRWDETVAVTLDTFRTMLDLMKEYPAFTFSQSQASVYSIVEEYDPDMLKEIKARIKEGRWEVTASTWVETDKNMPSGESLARHILYTKKYLSELLDIHPESLDLDFEPDTFGHSINVPEILAEGGVRYYYHCRGYEGHDLYRWKSPSQNSIIVYREPLWYNSGIDSSISLPVPEFCERHGINTMLKVYGVGDHGGGPTRKDIERLIDMGSWPVFPNIKLGTFHEFYRIVEESAVELPVVTGELNFVFDGCYTTQTRIKNGNRITEGMLNEAEIFSSVSALQTGSAYPSEGYGKAWRKVLFNQFHDILPGSGVTDTREYAMGLYQKVMAAATRNKTIAFNHIADRIDTSMYQSVEDVSDSRSEGAGAGYQISSFRISQCSRGTGKTRIFHFFNPSMHERMEAVEVVVWDWNGEIDRIDFKDASGRSLEHQVLQNSSNEYWGHNFIRVLVSAGIPACGYTTCIMTEKEMDAVKASYPNDPRVHKPSEYVLENSMLKVAFDPVDATIISIADKTSGAELVDRSRPAGMFRLVSEDTSSGMTAWIVGRYMTINSIHKNVRISNVHYNGSLMRKAISYEMNFLSSKLKVMVSLDENSSFLNYEVHCDWREMGSWEKGIPQLNFYMPFDYSCSAYKYDVPFGTIEREGMDMDVPANSWALAERQNGKQLMLLTGSKYGFRSTKDSMSITLIRGSFDPDPYPEIGAHDIRFAVGVVDSSLNDSELVGLAYDYNHPVSVLSGKVHTGQLQPSGSFMSVEEGSIAISAVKMAEDDLQNKMLVRVYEIDGLSSKAVICFLKAPKAAWFADINENQIEKPGSTIEVSAGKVSFDVLPYGVTSIMIEF